MGSSIAMLLAVVWFPCAACGQTRDRQAEDHMVGMADHAMSSPMNANMMKHMELSPVRAATHATR